MNAVTMASITIKSVPPGLHEGLKEAARRNHRSLQGEIIACLERHVERLPRRKEELLAEAALREVLPHFDHALMGGIQARREGVSGERGRRYEHSDYQTIQGDMQ